MSLKFDIKRDMENNRNNTKGLFIVVFYRVANFFEDRCFVLKMIGLPIKLMYSLIVKWVMGVELKSSTNIGPGLVIYHGQGLVVNNNVVIGKNVILRNNTTIGNKGLLGGKEDKSPIIGDNVQIGANVVIIGNIKIGDNAIIGAGSVVTKNIGKNDIVAGNPARKLKERIFE